MTMACFRVRCAAAALLLQAVAQAHSPHDVNTELAVSPAYAIDHTLFAAFTLTDTNLFAISTDSGRSWQYIGTPMAASSPRRFVFSPDFLTDRTAYAASTTSGVWRTTDGGQTWQLIDTGLPEPEVWDIAISPDFTTDRRLIVATEDGVYASDDAGDTWSYSGNGLAESKIYRVGLTHDGAGGLAAFAGGFRFAVSRDGGESWTDKGVFPQQVVSLCVSPHFETDHEVSVSFGRYGFGVVLSQDGGDTFSFVNVGLFDVNVEEIAEADDGTFFAVTDTAGCFRANSPGEPWQLVSHDWEKLSDLTPVHNNEVVVAPDFANDPTVFVGAFEGTYRSYDRGDNWLQLNVYTQLLNRRFVVSTMPGTLHDLLLGNYGGGVFHYRETVPTLGAPASSGVTAVGGALSGGAAGGPASGPAPLGEPGFAGMTIQWDARSTNLIAPWSSILGVSPGRPGQRTIIYGYNNLQQSTDEGVTWLPANKPPGVDVFRAIALSPQYATDGTIFLGTGTAGSYRSSDGCAHWNSISSLPASLSSAAIAIAPGWPADGRVFYASRNVGLWRSTDGGTNWAKQTTGLSTQKLKALVLSPDFASDQFAVLGTFDDGVYVSHDGGTSWIIANEGLPLDAVLPIESLAISPDFVHDHTVFVALQNHGVWRSTDGAQTWQATGPGLPAPPAEVALSPDYAHDETVFVGTFGGTLVSRDAGRTWQPLPGYVRVDDRHPAVIYEGTWKAFTVKEDVAGGVSQTQIVGDATWLEFYGRNITWYADIAFDGALAGISLDGGPPQVVDTSSHTGQHQAPIYTHDFGAPGWHVVRVTHAGSSVPFTPTLRSDGFSYEW